MTPQHHADYFDTRSAPLSSYFEFFLHISLHICLLVFLTLASVQIYVTVRNVKTGRNYMTPQHHADYFDTRPAPLSAETYWVPQIIAGICAVVICDFVRFTSIHLSYCFKTRKNLLKVVGCGRVNE